MVLNMGSRIWTLSMKKWSRFIKDFDINCTTDPYRQTYRHGELLAVIASTQAVLF